MTDQPNSETKSLEQPEPVDGNAEEGAAVQAESFDQETSTVPADELAQAPEVDGKQPDEPEGSVVEEAEESLDEPVAEEVTEQAEEPSGDVDDAAVEGEEEPQKEWYILKVQVNREDSIREALLRRIKIEGVEESFGEIVVPTEDVAEFNKSGKRRVVKKKLYPGYILVNMAINDDTWFLVRETPGVGDFTGSAGKPTPMETQEVERILKVSGDEDEGAGQIKTAIPFRSGDRVRVKDGYFQNFEGDVDAIDEANGRITVMINIFGRSTPVELEHWQVEAM